MKSKSDDITRTHNLAPDELPVPNMLSVMVLTGPSRGTWARLDANGGDVGRNRSAAVCVADAHVSREHAVVEYKDGRFGIVDKGSRFGVYVEGKRVEKCVLKDGDRLQLSPNSTLRVRYEDPEETALIEQLQQAASTDSLTGAYNRRHFMERLEQELSFSRRHNAPISLLMIDLDGFKSINDNHGHQVGDRVLKGVVDTLQRTARKEDILARYGGDEFVIISRGPIPAGLQFAERLRAAVAADTYKVGDHTLAVTISIGIAGYEPSETDTLSTEDILTCADSAVYASKRGGKNKTTTWDSIADRLAGVSMSSPTIA